MDSRIAKAQQYAREAGIDALLITPGADLRYLTGYEAKPLERLTCLVLPSEGEAVMVVPELERASALHYGVSSEIRSWTETEDPFDLVTSLLPADAQTLALDDQMWASRVLTLRDRLPDVRLALAGDVLRELRIIKSAEEIDFLRVAGATIDRVHDRMHEWLKPGRSELDVGADIARAILDEGHTSVDFVIVGSGPNGASPHHDVSDRIIEAGKPVVIDIGGTTRDGYCSDSTRNYIVGDQVPEAYERAYEALLAAQKAQCVFAGPGVSAEAVDRVGRQILDEHGYADLFIHRTGHGIGQETHEHPYIVEGNTQVLREGMAFSIEPGVYFEGQFGARIEDIVVCTEDGIERLNHTSRALRHL
ncbi:MAG: aminopeptidase family protein [Nocardioidaceae bacterium]|nr:aminopeptidase family protein [Nocardioidaceae bacterium]